MKAAFGTIFKLAAFFLGMLLLLPLVGLIIGVGHLLVGALIEMGVL